MPGGRRPGTVPANKGRATLSMRAPIRTAIPVVRQLMEIADASGLSLAEIERRVGLSHNATYRMRRGETAPGIQTLSNLADVLGHDLKLVPKEGTKA